jgi:peptidylprolyl isomerase
VDLPVEERPVVQVLDTGSVAFRTLADAARQARGADFSICDIDLPVQVSGPPTPAA